MPETYCYRRLSGSNYIRVLEVEPALRASSAIRGKLIEVRLSVEPQNRPKYEALSYVWGSPKGDRPILCEGKEILITENCEAALRQLRHQYRRRLLWIDAICIDQSHVPERNQQVEMMRIIYREADHVRVWLGSPSVDRSFLGLRLSLKTSEAIFKLIPSPWDSELHEFGANFLLHLMLLPYLVVLPPQKARDAVSRSIWFERIWTIQEVSFAQAATAHYGPISCEWDTFSNLLMGSDTSVFEIHDKNLRSLYSLRVIARAIANDARRPAHGDLGGRSRRSAEDLHEILDSLFYTKATDPKDKVFGIYGILLLLDVEIPPPDYSKTVAEIYTETINAILRWSGTFRFRHVFDPDENPLGLPSWVPNLSASNGGSFSRRPALLPPNASDGSMAFNIRHQRGTKLHAKAIIIDYVDDVGLAFPTAAKSLSDTQVSETLLSWREVSKSATDSSHDLDPADRAARSLSMLANAMFRDAQAFEIGNQGLNMVAVQEWFGNTERTGEIPDLFFGFGVEKTTLSSWQFEDYVRPGWEGQKIFKTHSNRLGMAGSPTSTGDVVMLVAGSDVPVVARPCGEDYTYIGPAYFPGAMDGSMWPNTNVGDRLRDVTFV